MPRQRALALGDPALRKALEDMTRRKVPPGEVDDIVQATLTEAIASATAPDDAESLRKWVFGIARHKIADYHRKSRRERPEESPEAEAPQAPHVASDLLRWAEKELPEGEGHEQTLDWLLREGEGEKLEAIAAGEKLPAPRVRQRVTRLRKHFRARWEAQLAALVAVMGVAVVAWFLLRDRRSSPEIVHEPLPPMPSADPSFEKARELRRLALEQCQSGAFAECQDSLDRARALDPTGDQAPEIAEARQKIAAGLAQPDPSGTAQLPAATASAPLVVPSGNSSSAPTPSAPTPSATGTSPPAPTGKAATKPDSTSVAKSPPSPEEVAKGKKVTGTYGGSKASPKAPASKHSESASGF